VKPSRQRRLALCGVLALAVIGAAVFHAEAGAAPKPEVADLIAVGDVASCDRRQDEQVAALVNKLPGTIALLGDAVYVAGTEEEFTKCFLPAWGRLLPRIRATLGDHEYQSGNAEAAIHVLRLPENGWYTYRLGAWKVIVLNSNCEAVGGCDRDSPQWNWLKETLETDPAKCTLAYWHHARFSSGVVHGSDTRLAPFWDLLALDKADLVLSGHEHLYERFGPKKGIRSFVVGTGGFYLYDFKSSRVEGSEAGSDHTYGALHLRLEPHAYSWEFVPIKGQRYRDTGSAQCR
jgi:hypothetical protein